MPRPKEVQLEDGWTRVCGKSNTSQVKVHGIPPLARDATLEKLRASFNAKLKVWRTSSACEAIRKMLDRECPDEGWSFDTALCLATGSFSRDNFENSKRSMFQFVTFIDTVWYLQRNTPNPIQMAAQDPGYTDLDQEFLASLDITLLDLSLGDGPQGLGPAKAHLSSQTAVFEYFMDMGPGKVRDILDGDLRLYIGSSFTNRVEDQHFRKKAIEERRKFYASIGFDAASTASQLRRDEQEDELMTRFVEGRRWFQFPQFDEDPLVLEGLKIYFKQPEDDEDD